MRIEVTQEDIDLGQQGHSESCAIARALKRSFVVKRVSVSGIMVDIGNVCYSPGPAIREWIITFDKVGKHAVKPFAFEIREGMSFLHMVKEEEPALIPANFPVMVKETVNAGRSEELRQG